MNNNSLSPQKEDKGSAGKYLDPLVSETADLVHSGNRPVPRLITAELYLHHQITS